MKLKTSPLFLLNQFCKIIVLIGLGSIPAKTFSADKNPGLIESFERLLEVHKKQFEQSSQKAQGSVEDSSNLLNYKEIKLDTHFMRSLLFHSDEKFLRLVQKDECKFWAALENNLLKTARGDVINIQASYQNKEHQTLTTSIPKDDFFTQLYKVKCLNNHEFGILFNESNYEKTINGIKFTVPKTTRECEMVHREWLENSFTPYLCRIQQTIKNSKDKKVVENYKTKINSLQRTYIDNLCNNLNSPERFCENYLKNDIWNKIINGEAPSYKMSFKCQNIFNKENELTPAEIKSCASKLLSEPALCETRGNRNYPSLFPLLNCDLISKALTKSKLVTDYHDCPGSVDNEAITNAHRIINHFFPRKIISTKETCAGEANYTFARLNLDISYEDGWPLKICFHNNVTNKEDCVPYIPGSREDEKLSEDQVIARILYQQKGASSKAKCRIVDSKTYNPLRSEFKFGCFIVYDSDTCTTLNCTKKVIWEEKTQSDIRYIGKPIFDYIPTAFLNERYSFMSLINEVKGIQSRPIKNLTYLKFYLDQISNSIIHGVGCAEDLIPEEFARESINQCHPIPFIIDGYTLKNNEIWLSMRTAIDDLHSPKLTLWQNVFNAISAYRELHPLNSWTLYGLKK